jgi:hypothetical protein
LWSLPADSCEYELRHTLPSTVKFLHEASNQENDAQGAKGIPYMESGSFKETVHEDGNKEQIPLMFNKNYMHGTRQQNQEIYGWSLNSLNTSKTISTNGIDIAQNAIEGCKIEGEKYKDIQSEYCPNQIRNRGLQVALEKLLRVNTMGSSTRTKWESCRFVYPQFHVRKDGSHEPMHNVPEGVELYESCRNRNSSPMVIEMIANEHERNLFASNINHGTYKTSNFSCIKPDQILTFILMQFKNMVLPTLY